MSDDILVERDGQIATVLFNRPKMRNAISLAMWSEIAAETDRLAKDDDVRAIVITGSAGDFCGGAHLNTLATAEKHFPWAGEGGPLHRRLSKPTIGAIEGCAQLDVRVDSREG